MSRRTFHPQTVLLLFGAVLFLSAVLPLKWTGWLGWFRGPAQTIIAPIAAPLSALAGWLRPGESRGVEGGPETGELRALLEHYKSEALMAQQRVQEMERVIAALQGGVAFGGHPRLALIEATRVGDDPGSGTISVSRGSAHGVTLSSVAVATAAPHHLVGVVTNVGPTVSAVQVITDPRLSPSLIEALVLPHGKLDASAVSAAVRGQFRPIGDGTLAGEIGVDDAAKVQRDAPVYLDDPSWPAGAQRLMIGRVVRVEETDKPLFRRVVLRPEFDLMRVRGVVLRTPVAEGAGGPVKDGAASSLGAGETP